MALAFIPNHDVKKVEVNHKDENKLNNNYTNLEWCTHQYNMNYGTIRERTRKTIIANQMKNGKARPILQISLDGDIINEYPSIHQAELELNASRGNITKCLKGQLKTSCGYRWEYAK